MEDCGKQSGKNWQVDGLIRLIQLIKVNTEREADLPFANC